MRRPLTVLAADENLLGGDFSRERLAGYDPAVLDRAAVLVVGAGALGQNLLISLALCGIRELRIVDDDLFEQDNRTRSPHYPTPAEQAVLGLEKARVSAAKLRPLMQAPRPRIRFAVAKIQELGLGAFHGVRAVASCVDNPRARAYLADATRLLALPLIEGGFEGPEITLSSFPAASARTASSAPCWRCGHNDLAGVFSCRFTAEQAEARGVIPAIQPAAATLAGLQAETTIMALHGRDALGGHAFDLNLRTGRSRRTRLSTDPRCAGVHRTLPRRRVQLQTRAAETVGDLLREVRDRLGEGAEIRLRDPFVLTAPCFECRRTAQVWQPSDRWASSPFCEDCGGTRPRSGSTSSVADVLSTLDRNTPAKIMAESCSTLGIVPLDILDSTDGRSPALVRLSGCVGDLYDAG